MSLASCDLQGGVAYWCLSSCLLLPFEPAYLCLLSCLLVPFEFAYWCALQELSPDQVVALVSCTIWQERSEAGQKVRDDMQGPYGALTEAARRVAKVWTPPPPPPKPHLPTTCPPTQSNIYGIPHIHIFFVMTYPFYLRIFLLNFQRTLRCYTCISSVSAVCVSAVLTMLRTGPKWCHPCITTSKGSFTFWGSLAWVHVHFDAELHPCCCCLCGFGLTRGPASPAASETD